MYLPEDIEQQNGRYQQFFPFLFISALLLGVLRNNAFLTSFGILLGGIYGLSWVWWRLSFWNLTSEFVFEEIRVFEGEEIKLKLVSSNRKYLPLFWVNIFYDLPGELKFRDLDMYLDASTQRRTLRSYWSFAPMQTIVRTYTIVCDKRGFYTFGPIRMETGDPFGFFSGIKKIDAAQTFIIYPKVYPITPTIIPAQKPFGESRSVGRLFEDPMRTIGVREWQPGDQMRRIHWAKTAKYQSLHSRVYEPVEEEQVMILLNIATMAQYWQRTNPEIQERAVRVAASLAYQYAEQRLPFGLIANGRFPKSDQSLKLLPGRSPHQLMILLELLAGVSSFATSPFGKLLNKESPNIPWGTTLVVITCTTHDALIAHLEALAAAGRQIVLISLSDDPPPQLSSQIVLYHVPRFDLDDTTVIAPRRTIAPLLEVADG